MAYNFFNPFDFIIETKASPHARTLRTTLWEKLKDTFWVLNGSFFSFSRWKNHGSNTKLHSGILDYLTFGIPKLLYLGSLFAISRLFDKDHKNPNFLIKAFLIMNPKAIKTLSGLFLLLFGLPALALNAAVGLVSLALTIPLSSLVTIVHLFSKIKGDKYKAEAARALSNNDTATANDYEALITKDTLLYDSANLNLIKKSFGTAIESEGSKALMKLNFDKITSTLEKDGYIVDADAGIFTKNPSP